jgi:septal ring factor EnvC (AmiA/AmiB activator)
METRKALERLIADADQTLDEISARRRRLAAQLADTRAEAARLDADLREQESREEIYRALRGHVEARIEALDAIEARTAASQLARRVVFACALRPAVAQ